MGNPFKRITNFAMNPFDVMGTDAAGKAAQQGQAGALAAQERMFDKQMELFKEERGISRDAINRGYDAALSTGRVAADKRVEMMGQGLRAFDPYVSAGAGGLSSLQQLLSSPMEVDVTQDPGYQFRMREGEQALQRRQAAAGTAYGGGALKELAKYSQGLASQEYGAAWNRGMAERQQRLSSLSDLASMGMSAAGTQANIYGQQAANIWDPSQYHIGRAQSLAGLSQQYTGQAAGALGNLGAAQSQYWQNIGAIGAQRATAPFQNLLSLGQAAGGAMEGIGAIMMASDRRLKNNIVKVDTFNGMNVYDFNYIWDDSTTYRGLMAQEVQKVIPEAVEYRGDFMVVNYSKVMETINGY